MIAQRCDQFGRHQLDGASLLQGVHKNLLQLLRAGAFEGKPHPHTAAERQQLFGPQSFEQAAVACQDDGEQDMAVEPGGREQAQLCEHGLRHLLRFIDHQHGA